ncbi:ribosome-binding protein 1 isoform X1 [Rhagoletis pomonella]|uniref:ribosome-binding protein 1 isoform X1 n=1 Tax=Rhagoletis pomonella TaxID=28610 RepID=UPI00177BE49D|nr:ribosome-binding protein 1 isoform X1 [Rhagoletis pomonella]XP_036329850.1 ribosome-binding protein 1 isoform X1 [Rhagoletis pomonella]XP_036329855.1 ribosome-binding protein 1 isoform X1 [Rhagoletis pomonella]XP_036329861.1 ribosome-binding protein 1 isoform X1 [Rhagoletis pomonella]XP_036329868.1 ribosome-binding protein 1 isoform X1 [Rhagoletis pomonella]XP_036329876.1 ribosome-binding protein 1 isoform X1 [Rhagoletis pomonella]XP_036329882.1 ribosome-binding protein 1 isoform X1 [Rhago
MMDFHLLVIISCVFLASLLSLLFINKFFRRKTFEEVVAEKKALTDKIYAQSKVGVKKPKKQQPTKKDLKREKKKLQREQQKENTEQEDSDAQSEQPSVEDEPQGLSKTHVEFDPDPEVIVGATPEAVRRASIAEKENLSKPKSKKEKKSKSSGILVNKNEPVIVRENLVIEEPANTFEIKQPKDILELKKHEKKDNKKEKNIKKEKNVPVEKPAPVVVVEQQQQPVAESVTHVHVAKELKQQDDKARHGSPKTHVSNNASGNNKTVKQQNKKQNKETAATKELVLALDKLSDSDTIGVSLLMNLFRRAELNRSEIQILIDYLLNKQQDTPATHSEWSDDICQKLKRQLEEKEKALTEEQEASMGIQAKLRELRTEINTERAQLNATVKVYVEKLQSKEQEITALNQEIQVLNDKFAQERKQFQAKLLLEKQNGSQDLFAQLQRIQSELAHKDKCINDLTCLVNACNQANEELKQQVSLLEQQREELEQISNNRIFELEKAKALEIENAERKLELHNLQNAHESTKADLAQARQELDTSAARSTELVEKQNQIVALQAKNEELLQQLAGINSQAAEQSGLQTTLGILQLQLSEKENLLADSIKNNTALRQKSENLEVQMRLNAQHHHDLQNLIDSLQRDIASKHQQLQHVEQTVEQLSSREKEVLQQLHEQKEKNDDLRKKNWKLVEALQSAETTARQNKAPKSANESLVQQQQLFAASQKQQSSSATANAATTVSAFEEKHIREIFQRLYPEAAKACASTALSASFEQWVEQVLATQLKLTTASKAAGSSSNKSTQSSSSNSSSSNHTPSTHTNNNSHNDNLTNNSNNRISNNSTGDGESSGSGGGGNDIDAVELRLQNTQLRAKVDELTKLVTKTSNTLSALEGHARQEHEKWQSILLSKEEEISRLQHSNGAQDI